MADRSLWGSIALTKLQHVILEKAGQGGKIIKGIFLPIDANLFTEKDGAVYMSVNVKVKEEEDQYKQHGFISKTTDTKLWKTLDEAGKKKAKELSPILGSIKDFDFSGANDTAGAASSTPIGEKDDLPW